MRPLVYLTVRSFVNGVRRSLTSGRRLISLLFVLGYYYFFFMRSLGPGPRSLPAGRARAPWSVPPVDVLEAFVFGFFAVMTLLLALGSSVQRMTFRPADVDVLFPTPIAPRLVLLFRLLRDYLLTLLLPLLMAVLTWRPTTSFLTVLFKNLPRSAEFVGRAVTIAWLLLALAWVSLGYAASLFVNRSDLESDRNRRILTYGGIGLFLAISGYIAWRVSHFVDPLPDFVALTRDPVMRAAFFTATFAQAMVMAPLRGEWGGLGLGAGALLALTGLGLWVSLTQAGWLYDQAAARGFDTLRLRKMQQQGDMMGMIAEQARQGRFKGRRGRWLSRLRARGPAALLWREAIVQVRAMPLMVLMFAAMGVLFGVLPFLVGRGREEVSGTVFLAMQAMSTFIATMALSQSGFIELLRRVDLEKPLPFTAATIAFAEIVAKAMPAMLSIAVAAFVSVVLMPPLWPYALASLLGLPPVAVLFSAAVFVVTVLFPDVDDPTQRGFRGLMTMLGLAILSLPVVLAFGLTMLLLKDFVVAPVVGALVAAGAALALSVLAAWAGGGLYAQYNPSE